MNDEVHGVSLYKPAGFTIAEKSDAQNIVMKKGDDSFLLFINPNEEKDSRLFYDLLTTTEDRERFEEVFTDDGYFGFASVAKKGEDTSRTHCQRRWNQDDNNHKDQRY